MAITFRPLTEADFPLLRRWLAEPHVARWWHHDTTEEAVRRDFGPSVRGEEPGEDLIALLDGQPFGLLQRARIADYPDELAAWSAVVEVPDGAVMLDYLIGDPGMVGKGLGPRMIRAAVDAVWEECPDAPCVMIAVVATNRRSWRAVEKAGLRRVAEGDMTPDNPIDDPSHYVYRVDRPAGLSSPRRSAHGSPW